MRRKCINSEKLNRAANFKGERLKLCEHTMATSESVSWLSRLSVSITLICIAPFTKPLNHDQRITLMTLACKIVLSTMYICMLKIPQIREAEGGPLQQSLPTSRPISYMVTLKSFTLGLETERMPNARGTARRIFCSPYCKRCSKDRIAISRPSSSAIATSAMPNTAGA